MGLINDDIKNDKAAKQLSNSIYNHGTSSSLAYIDHITINFCENFLKIPTYMINLFIEGYIDENKVAAYHNFFYGNVDQSLSSLLENDNSSDLLAFDLANSLQRFQENIKNKPSTKILNNMWRNKTSGGYELGNPYPSIVLFCLTKTPLEEIISTADLSLSEKVITNILSEFGTKNINGNFNIQEITLPATKSVNRYIHLLKNPKKENIRKMLIQWIHKVELDLNNTKNNWFKQLGLTSVFYRYIQLNHACGIDNRKILARNLVNFLKDRTVHSSDKKLIIELITEECKKYYHPLFGEEKNNPLETLFSFDFELMRQIKQFSQRNTVKYINEFNSLVSEHETRKQLLILAEENL